MRNVNPGEAQMAAKRPPGAWLLFIHQIPKDPAYLRVKIGRRLAAVGAVAIKNSVYVLPSSDACREDFSWLRREILDGGGEAAVFEAHALEGLTSAEVERLFREARKADYERLAEKLEKLEREFQSTSSGSRQAALAELGRLMEQVAEVERVDFFSQQEAAALRDRIGLARESVERRHGSPSPKVPRLRSEDYQGRTWVTRQGVKIDRLACTWLIRRFVDGQAKFRFVDPSQYTPRKGELRFDMAEGEFTHEGELCSFEVLCLRFGIERPEVKRIAEYVHDLDIKDARYGHPETEGIRMLIDGLVATHAADAARIEASAPVFDALCAAAPTSKAKKR
jgi:hypothetical protein